MTTEEKIKVMQAYEDGKQIQLLSSNKWKDWQPNFEPTWNWGRCEYRIKPEEPTYRPYKDTEELIADYEERFYIDVPCYVKPFIWVKSESSTSLITAFEGKEVGLLGFYYASISLARLYKEFTYLDGSPIGKLVEE